MIEYLFKNAEFSKIFRFISPGFLRVISPTTLIGVAHQLKTNRKDQATWLSLAQRYSTMTSLPPIFIQIDAVPNAGFRSKTQLSEAISLGTRVLTLFFHQILTQSTWILDFRSEAFQGEMPSGLKWQPQPYFYEVSPKFLDGIRALYLGFYTSDDRLFDQALVQLGLSGARQSLRNHFGGGDQTKIQFQLKLFQNTFTDVFEACAKTGVKLQPDFFVLGLSLLSLYENLETLSVSFNVRACFEQALQMSREPT